VALGILAFAVCALYLLHPVLRDALGLLQPL
jgi:hypothetical protein